MQSNFRVTTLDACPYCGTRGEAEGPNCEQATALAFARLCQHVHDCAFNPKNMPWQRERRSEAERQLGDALADLLKEKAGER